MQWILLVAILYSAEPTQSNSQHEETFESVKYYLNTIN